MTQTAQYAISIGKGNCREFTAVAMFLLKQKYPNIPTEKWRIENGDHVFPVIGVGEDRVVLDALSGKCYPFNVVEHELSAYICLGKQTATGNIIVFKSLYFLQSKFSSSKSFK